MSLMQGRSFLLVQLPIIIVFIIAFYILRYIGPVVELGSSRRGGRK